MSSKILFVFEGTRPDTNYAKGLQKNFMHGEAIIHTVYCAEIYQLYEEIKADTFLDTFSLLKERVSSNNESLSEFEASDFSEIYLFFDYDGHASKASDDKIKELLEFFNQETEHGRLLLSYPMVESLRHYSEKIDFKNLRVKAKENIRYKQLVGETADKKYLDIKKYDKSVWNMLIREHLNKLNFLMTEEYILPQQYYSQKDIFDQQLVKYLIPDNMVAVLSAFPVFICDYYGTSNIENILSK